MKNVGIKIAVILILIMSCLGLSGCSDQTNADSQTLETIHNGKEASDSAVTDIPASVNIPDITIVPSSTPEPKDTPTVTGKPENSGSTVMPIFTETSETVYATADVNVRTSCSTTKDNVIAILQKGSPIKRIGISEGWSKVLFRNEECYIKNDYLGSVRPVITDEAKKPSPTPSTVVTKAPAVTPEPTNTSNNNDNTSSEKKDFVANLKIATNVNKLIVVIGNGGADCIVSFHTKDKNGTWLQQFSTDGDCGYKGITYHKKEGDGKTPAGLYAFTMAFGIKPDPGAKLTYRQVAEYDYWVDDVKSPYYNTWVNSLGTPGDYTSEHLIDHSPQYNYALNIDYNSDNTPGLGSAIFLHGYNGKGQTTGCIAISEKYVKTLIQEVDSSTRILIVPEKDDLDNY